MNKIAKAIAAITATAVIAATTIGSSAYNGNATDYNSGPLSLKKTVYTKNGLLVSTQAQRDMYPTFSLDDIMNGYYFCRLREAGHQQMVLGQRHMGIEEYAQKLGAVCAIFEYDEGSGKWPDRSVELYSPDKTGYYGVYNQDHVHWVQGLTFSNIPKGTSVALTKASTDDIPADEAPLIAYVTRKQPEIVNIFKQEPGWSLNCGSNPMGDSGPDTNRVFFVFDDVYAGIDMQVKVNGKWYDAYCCDAHPGYANTVGEMLYYAVIPENIERVSIRGIRIINAAGEKLINNPELFDTAYRNIGKDISIDY